METETLRNDSHTLTMVFDDRCSVVGRLAHLVKLWDKDGTFTLIPKTTGGATHPALVTQLDTCPWSLLLVDASDHHWSGPDAVPIILKKLPFGKIAAVLYVLPGTVWLSEQLYLFVSRHHRRISPAPNTVSMAEEQEYRRAS